MVYPDGIEIKLGFTEIRKLLKTFCLSVLGEKLVDNIEFLSDSKEISRLLAQTDDFRKILVASETFPSSNYIDIARSMEKITVAGSFLDKNEMYDVGVSLSTIIECVRFFQLKGDLYPHLHELSAQVDFDTSVASTILSKFDERANIKDNASPALSQIRADLAKQDNRLRRIINGLLKKAKEDGHAPADGQVSIRDGRLVIPILAESKRRVKGVVQDESATGQTAFIEPTQAIEINNDISDLRFRERREIVKILTELSDLIRPAIPSLLKANLFLGQVDFIRAKGKLAIALDCQMPSISKNRRHQLVQARHPLLLLHHKEIDKPVIPLNCELQLMQRILVISGPNAGGKSVALKTIGLLQYMLQCGLLVPASETSEMMVFKQLFIDIGDEQSIENDLSTYSSHLTNLRFFLEHGNKKTLFLIDEFGTGTEPQFGGSIAEVILEQLNILQAFGVVTTHYSNLKKMADTHEGIVNAAMRFDVEQLSPLYILEIGKPGSSFALEIAAGIGLDSKLVEKAKKLIGHSHIKFEELTNQLEFEKNQYQEKLKEVTRKEKWLEAEQKDYQDLKDYLDTERKNIINEAKRDAKHLISSANQKIEKTIKGIKESAADKSRTKKLREELAQHDKKLDLESTKSTSKSKAKEPPPSRAIRIGDKVKIRGQESIGEVVLIKGKKAEILMGSLKSIIDLSKLELQSTSEKVSYNKSSRTEGVDYVKKAANFNPTIDLRGKRAEEAVAHLDPFIDEALLLGIDELRIIHGKGNGVLREVVRTYLREYGHIKNIRDEHIEQGGSGVSVVTLN